MDFLYTISFCLLVLAHVAIAMGGVFGVSLKLKKLFKKYPRVPDNCDGATQIHS